MLSSGFCVSFFSLSSVFRDHVFGFWGCWNWNFVSAASYDELNDLLSAALLCTQSLRDTIQFLVPEFIIPTRATFLAPRKPMCLRFPNPHRQNTEMEERLCILTRTHAQYELEEEIRTQKHDFDLQSSIQSEQCLLIQMLAIWKGIYEGA